MRKDSIHLSHMAETEATEAYLLFALIKRLKELRQPAYPCRRGDAGSDGEMSVCTCMGVGASDDFPFGARLFLRNRAVLMVRGIERQ